MSIERSTQILNAREIPISHVTVFTDRAEITRIFNVNLKSGINEIRLENVASTVAPNSIFVDGKGNASILGVNFEAKASNPSTDDLDKIKILKEELKEVQTKLETEKELATVLTAKLAALNNMLNKFTEKSDKKKEETIFSETMATSVDSLFEFYEKKVMELNARIKAGKNQREFLEQEVQRLQVDIHKYTWNNKVKNIITIELECETSVENEAAELTLIYQVFGASWSSAYDLKVKSKQGKSEMALSYYANIHQQTGEEWKDVELSLSTAQPSLGNDLPKLGTTVVQFYRPPQIYHPPPQMLARRGGGPTLFSAASASYSADSDATLERAPQMKQAIMEAEENVLSTTFHISQKKTIPSDSTSQKVTVTIQALTAHFHFECVPKKDTKVYLLATVINDSDFPLLPGVANVYLNNSFTATINLKGVSPGETFDCSLGVDKSVKVIYKPTHKYQSQLGMFTTTFSSGNEQKIIVKNTKRSEAIRLTLHEPIPKSSDEKIKVKILAPDTLKPQHASSAKETKEKPLQIGMPVIGAILDDLNNLMWTETIQPEKEKEFIIKWAVEYPPNEKIEYKEQHQVE